MRGAAELEEDENWRVIARAAEVLMMVDLGGRPCGKFVGDTGCYL